MHISGAIYLTGDNFMTNGEKMGSLTFCWEKKKGEAGKSISRSIIFGSPDISYISTQLLINH